MANRWHIISFISKLLDVTFKLAFKVLLALFVTFVIVWAFQFFVVQVVVGGLLVVFLTCSCFPEIIDYLAYLWEEARLETEQVVAYEESSKKKAR